MKLAVVQFAPEWGNKARNLEYMSDRIEEVPADLIVFPELALTGYYFDSREEMSQYAEPFNGRAVSHLQFLATKTDKIVVAGFPETESGKIFNSATILFPEKEKSKVYRKTHLFYREQFCFSAGDTGFFVIEDKKRDFRLGTMICYDWRFPEAARSLAVQGADVIVCPSNLVTHVWQSIMPARALENMVFLAVANRTGTEERKGETLAFNGDSAIYDCGGKILAKAGKEDESVLSVEINPADARHKNINVFNDIMKGRRPEMYSKITE
ncbi:MAG: nitrilase-related carbon-nitrogen hydrolase [Bacteroidota bacterium]